MRGVYVGLLVVVGVVGTFGGVLEMFGTADGHVSKGVFAVLIGLVGFAGSAMFGELARLRDRIERIELTRGASPPEPVHHAAPAEAPAEPRLDDADAKAVLQDAQDHHFSQRFPEARVLYADLVARYPDTKQAVVAQQQLENLRRA